MLSSHSRLICCTVLLLGMLLVTAAQNNPQPEKSLTNTNLEGNELSELTSRAGAYWDKGDYTNALPLFEQILGMTENALGRNHPLVARDLWLLAHMHTAHGNPEKALRLLRRGIAIIEKHPE